MVGLDKQADLQNIFKLIISCFILELIEWKVWAPIPTKACSLNIFFFSENEMSTTFADDDCCYLAVTTMMGSGQKKIAAYFHIFVTARLSFHDCVTRAPLLLLRSWVALSFKVCLSIYEVSVTDTRTNLHILCNIFWLRRIFLCKEIDSSKFMSEDMVGIAGPSN